MRLVDLSGTWSVDIPNHAPALANLPGTLDENEIGFPDTGNNQWHPENNLGNDSDLVGEKRILTRLTRNHTYEGNAHFTRTVLLDGAEGKRVFLEVERSRKLSLRWNGRPVPEYTPGTVSTPYIFEITDYCTAGENECVLCCDNSYTGWPRDAIVFSSAATDETQTNWNGLLGYLRLRVEERAFISALRVYPGEDTADAVVEIDCPDGYMGKIELISTAFSQPASRHVSLLPGRHSLRVESIALDPGAARWDEEEGNLHTACAQGEGLERVCVRFGIRTFGNLDGRLALNGRKIFLRSEANCCVFPETGHMPMTVEEWKQALGVFRSYGVNCMRFHSHCPPGAAFAAADEMGMMMQPELSHWNPRTAYEDEQSWAYYQLELEQIIKTYANHPSFVLMTFGNELSSGALGLKRMTLLLCAARQLDSTRLYAHGSNNFLGKIGADPCGDFYTSSNNYAETMLRATSSTMRGYLNEKYPDAKTNFEQEIAEIRAEGFAKPVYGFEVGQYEVLPDFDEWEGHQGVTRPDNYDHIRDRVTAKGLLPTWKKRVEATGELSLLGYREEIEGVLRTPSMSGLSLLSLQDFPGQGTALVGMINAHLKPKPFDFAKPERLRSVYANLVPLAYLDQYTYVVGETLTAPIKIANHTKEGIHEGCRVQLLQDGCTVHEETLPAYTHESGSLSDAGTLSIDFTGMDAPARLTLALSIGGAKNEYPLWVYPNVELTVPDGVVMTSSLEEALAALRQPQSVFLTPPATQESFPLSIPTQFSTDFWSVGTFAKQSGFMGCLVDPAHPVFKEFPTEFHTNWQWWPMCKGRAIILPDGFESLVTALDCYARMRNMGMLVEANVGKGRLVISSMGLLERQDYPEVRALTQSIVNYVASDAFHPAQTITAEELRKIVR